MRLAPADVVSTWPEANFANPETHGPALSIANGFFMALMLIVVFLRYYSRYSTRSRLGLDDIFIGLSAVCYTMPDMHLSMTDIQIRLSP